MNSKTPSASEVEDLTILGKVLDASHKRWQTAQRNIANAVAKAARISDIALKELTDSSKAFEAANKAYYKRLFEVYGP